MAEIQAEGKSTQVWFGKLIVSKASNGGLYRVELPFAFEHPDTEMHVVPVDFTFDGNSLPRLFWVVSTPTDYLESGCIHDYLYRHGAELSIPRGTVDKVYRDFLAYQGANAFRRWTRWFGVRMFGWGPYKEQ